ncbi:Ras family [Nesidiocoris tenuis]|uniref:Ras family n=1 Tax=Nesidiocoris tenuis TaxID=355587 RepID=A0ABN7B739_9HEMI|nr:Ras family [Nesidiocoris tenuis]
MRLDWNSLLIDDKGTDCKPIRKGSARHFPASVTGRQTPVKPRLPEVKSEKSPQKLSEDVIATASTALRRLHFRGASRKAKLQSSLESANTSTDSSNTVITMVTVDTDDETIRITPNLLEDLGDSEPPKLPPKRLKLLKRYARTNLEEERTPHGRGSSGFAAVQMTIDSEFGETIDRGGSSPPLPDSPTSRTKNDLGSTATPEFRQATTCIVIQQASVCGNSPEADSDVDSSGGGGGGLTVDLDQLRREENMRLLEVATTLTEDQLHEFDRKYGSPHHARSQSVRPRNRPTFLSLPQARTRVASMPNTGAEEHYYRLRHFSIAGKSVVNKGDSLRSRKPKSRESVISQETSSGPKTGPCSRQSSVASCASLPSCYKVVMVGSSDVGKSSLISQFMTSEYLHSYDNSIDDEFGEKSVSVLLDGEESELIFVDHSSAEMSPTSCLDNYRTGPHGYCVVYSTSDRSSFKTAEELLQMLWKDNTIKNKAVILVANKTDLVRSRTVSSQEGKHLATSYDCKYIETSVGFNHNVDELLVGLLSQIRLKQEQEKEMEKRAQTNGSQDSNGNHGNEKQLRTPKTPPSFPKSRNARTSASLKVKGLLSKVWARDSKSKSCENLHVL